MVWCTLLEKAETQKRTGKKRRRENRENIGNTEENREEEEEERTGKTSKDHNRYLLECLISKLCAQKRQHSSHSYSSFDRRRNKYHRLSTHCYVQCAVESAKCLKNELKCNTCHSIYHSSIKHGEIGMEMTLGVINSHLPATLSYRMLAIRVGVVCYSL